MDCLDEDTVLALADGRLSDRERARVERHIDECEACRELVVDVTRLDGESDAAAIHVGTAIDHYVVTRWLGSGATAAVYAVTDLRIEREVALKLFHGDDASAAGDELASAEAVALGKLRHPHVLTVHAIGAWDERPYIVTELIDGDSLREWVASRRPSWRVLLRALVQAGEGLAAAHDAGVVHRDFKPEHVIIAPDGRAIVVDFGFAQLRDRTDRDVAGTPAWMAPEQRAGHADARSDQYAFARVALEALGGGFESRRRRIPRGLRGALARASSADPSERFADMHGLLAALARAQRRRRVAAAAVAVVSSTAIAAALGWAFADPGLHVCTTAATPDALWRAAIDRGAPVRVWPDDSPSTSARAHAAADRFVAAWSSAAAEVCADADADAVADIASCLEGGRAEFGRLLESPAAADPVDFLTHLEALERPAACLDAPGASPPSPDEIAGVRRLLADVERLDADGDPQAAIEIAAIAVDEARALGFAPLRVRAELAMGTLLADHGQGTTELEQATRSAADLGLDPLRAKGLLALASAALGNGEPELAAAHVQEAEAIVARLGDSAPELQIDLYGMKGMLAYGEGAYEDALRHAERAIEICRAHVDPRLSKAQFNAGSILQGLGREREALDVFEAARDEMMGELGPDHADVGRAWHSIGAAHNALGEAEAAMPAFDQALQILADSVGEDHVDTLKSVFGRGNALLQLGRVEEALVSYDACVTALGREEQPPVLLVFCLDSQAKAHAELGRAREAGNLWRRAYGLAQSRAFAKLPIRATIPFSLAQIDLAEGDLASARVLMRDAEAAAREAQWDATSLRSDIDAWFAAHGR